MAMKPEELLSFVELFYSNNIALMKKKNADYSGGVQDAHANFKALELMSGLDNATAIGFLTRMADKFMRVVSFVKKGRLEVEDEGVKDSLADLANYCALMAAWIANVQEEAEARRPVTPSIDILQPLNFKDFVVDK